MERDSHSGLAPIHSPTLKLWKVFVVMMVVMILNYLLYCLLWLLTAYY